MKRFALRDDEEMRRHLAQHPRALVAYRGIGCPFSARFAPVFEARDVEGWARAERLIERGGRGPHAVSHGIARTPTVIAYVDGEERSRLEARLLVGITGRAYEAWLAALARLA